MFMQHSYLYNSNYCSAPNTAELVKQNLFFIIFVIAVIVFVSSHPLQSIFKADVKVVFVFAISLLCFLAFKTGLGDKTITMNVLFLSFAGGIGSLFSGTTHQLYIGLAGAGMLFSAAHTQPMLTCKKGLKVLLALNFFILVGACIGFIYALLGGPPTFIISNNENQQHLYFYLTTFTNSVDLNLIRPSGVFDEPGALAFFSIITTCFNELGGGNRRTSYLILFLNLFSFSMMAFVAIALFISINIKFKLNIKSLVISCLIIVALVSSYEYYGGYLKIFYLDRVKIEDGRLAGDNRSNQVIEFFSSVNSDIFLSGAESLGLHKETDQSSNPFSILYSSGFFVWLPYALFISWLLITSFRSSSQIRFAKIIFALLLLQRPYIYSMYWGIIIFALAVAILRREKQFFRYGY